MKNEELKKSTKEKKTKKVGVKSNFAKSVATVIVVVFVLALFIWTLDPNMREQVWAYLKGQGKLISVNGESVISPYQLKSVIESRSINMANYPDAYIMQFLQNFEEIQSLINQKLLIEYADSIGLRLSPESKQLYAIELYQKNKRAYETKYNMRYTAPIENFFIYAEEAYFQSLVEASITQGILVSKAEAELRFKLENTKRKVEYIYYDYEDYLKSVEAPAQDLKSYFYSGEGNSIRSNIRNKVRVISISGTDNDKMLKLLIQLENTPGMFETEAKKQNQQPQDLILNSPELFALRQVDVGKYSQPIERIINGQKTFQIFKLIRYYERDFNELSAEEITKIKEEYFKSSVARNKNLASFQTKVKIMFAEIKEAAKRGADIKAEAAKRGLKFGTTDYFPATTKDVVDNTITETVQDEQKRPISFFASSNKVFFDTVFKLKPSEISEMQNNGFIYYLVKLIDTKQAPEMDLEAYKKYLTSLTKQNQSEIRARILRELHTKFKVHWDEKNIIQLVKAVSRG